MPSCGVHEAMSCCGEDKPLTPGAPRPPGSRPAGQQQRKDRTALRGPLHSLLGLRVSARAFLCGRDTNILLHTIFLRSCAAETQTYSYTQYSSVPVRQRHGDHLISAPHPIIT
ncbi:hypothetical protein R5R35_008884 [Gryllus longicercus]|uniref:Uncharacterized protein n=1 Tax=Gryllus longicercus TaxID=2509291 RepID=A0AAN9VC67_9ORTH